MSLISPKIIIHDLEIQRVKDTVTILAGEKMSLPDAAKVIGYTASSLYKQYKNKGMPTYYRQNTRIRYKYQDLVDWMNNMEKIEP